MYDSSGQGSQSGRQVVHSRGVNNEIVRATPTAAHPVVTLQFDLATRSTAQQHRPISTIERPMVLRMSTRSRSVQGAQGKAMAYSCSLNSKPSPRISAPRRMVV